MNFASFQFVGFFLVLLSLYWLAPGRQFKNLILISGSYYFYSCWDVRFLALIVVCTAFSYFCAGQIQRHQADGVRKKRWLVAYLVFSLGVLGVFKYFNFFVGSMAALLQASGLNVRNVHLNIILPAAISFYTFESISYVVGAFKGELKRKASYLDYSLFIAFFPKLVAGPIERATHLLPQMENPRRPTYAQLRRGFWLILHGYLMKVVLADNLVPFVDEVFNHPTAAHGLQIPLALLAFAFSGVALPCATLSATAADNPWHGKAKELLTHAISIPTVAGRGKVPELAVDGVKARVRVSAGRVRGGT